MDEPHFIVNDFLLRSQEELSKVEEVVSTPVDPVLVQRSLFLKEFTLGLYEAYLLQKHKTRAHKKAHKENLEKRRAELLSHLENLQKPVTVPKFEQSVAQPVASFEEAPKPVPQTVLAEGELPPLSDVPEP